MAEASACLADSSLGPKASDSWREGGEREGGSLQHNLHPKKHIYIHKLVKHAQCKIIVKSFNCKNTTFHVIFGEIFNEKYLESFPLILVKYLYYLHV